MINELKDYYITKHGLISVCRQKTLQMASIFRDFYPELHNKVEPLYTTIQHHHTTTTDSHFVYISDFAQHMMTAAEHTSTDLAEIHTLIDLSRQQKDKQVNLEGFKEPPKLSQVFPIIKTCPLTIFRFQNPPNSALTTYKLFMNCIYTGSSSINLRYQTQDHPRSSNKAHLWKRSNYQYPRKT